jgi:sulfoxide reductase heme-binding subunit YedZ
MNGERTRIIPIRYDLFGFANYTGLGATLLLALLLALSNDFSMRKLGSGRWKNLQRLNYILFAFVFLHGAAYQFLEKRMISYVVTFALMIAVVVVIQLAGFWQWKSQKRRS